MKGAFFGILLLFIFNVASANIINDLLKTTSGLLHAWADDGEQVEQVLHCMSGLNDDEKQIADIIETIKHLDFTDFEKLLDSIMRIANDVKIIIRNFDPCFDTGKELIVILKKLFITPVGLLLKFFKNLTHNGPRVYDDTMSLIDDVKEARPYEAGYHGGDLFWVLLLKQS